MLKNPMTLRALIVLVLALAFWIPLGMVHGVVVERSHYHDAAAREIAVRWTGSQHLIGPLVIATYETVSETRVWNRETERYESKEVREGGRTGVLPLDLSASAILDSSTRHLGIFEIPVYESEVALSGKFPEGGLAAFAAVTENFSKFVDIRVIVALSDQRGITHTGQFRLGENDYEYAAGAVPWGQNSGLHIIVPDVNSLDGQAFSTTLKFRGSQSLALSPLGTNAALQMTSDWPHPGFSGRLLPTDSSISDDGFTANWSLSVLATNADQQVRECLSGECSGARVAQIDIELVEPVDLYASVERAVKYGMLFILTTFVACFLTETLSGKKLHPFHYLLVGCAQAIFFLLLVSFAEHVAFGYAYLVSLIACAALIAIYLAAVLRSVSLGACYGAGVAAVLGMLFAILRSEDYALLMGSLMLFAMLSIVMLATRRIDWYQLGVAK